MSARSRRCRSSSRRSFRPVSIGLRFGGGGQQNGAGAPHSAIGPTVLLEENLPFARIAVKPAREQPEVLGKFAGGSFALRFKLLAEQLFGGARFACECAEANREGFDDAAGADLIDGDGLFFAAALEDDGVQVLQAARQLRLAAESVIELV